MQGSATALRTASRMFGTVHQLTMHLVHERSFTSTWTLVDCVPDMRPDSYCSTSILLQAITSSTSSCKLADP